MQIRLKSLSFKDLKACANLVRNSWYLNDSGPMLYKFLLSLRYFLSSLKDADHALVARQGDKVHALLLLSMHNLSDRTQTGLRYRLLYVSCNFLNFICKRLSYLSSDYAYDEKYIQQYSHMHQIAKNNKIKGCELILIISDGSIKGLGATLLKAGERLAQKYKEPCLYLLTDESCNYTFYHRHNYKQCYSELLDFTIKGQQSYMQKCFIYKKDLYRQEPCS